MPLGRVEAIELEDREPDAWSAPDMQRQVELLRESHTRRGIVELSLAIHGGTKLIVLHDAAVDVPQRKVRNRYAELRELAEEVRADHAVPGPAVWRNEGKAVG